MGALQAAGERASAQTASDPDAFLMRPALDGNPQDPPRFRPARSAAQQGVSSRIGELPNFSYRPALGAGTTGFDSSSARKRKGKLGQKPKPAGTTDPAAAQPGGSAPKPGTAAKPDTASSKVTPARTDPPAFTPAQLQPAAGPLIGRARFQNRPGAPPLVPDAVVATIATTPPSRRPLPEEKPFDPLGIQVGAFNLRPAFDYTRGYDNNAPRNSTPPRASSWYNVYAPELLIKSNWARHELTANLRGSHTTYDTNHPLDRPNVDANVNARVDVTSETRTDLEGRYLLVTDDPG